MRELLASLAWTSLLIVSALWVSGGGVQALADGVAEAITTLGRLTGLVAADLLLIQVLLMARIPFVERVYGQDDLALKHRLVGFTSFTLLIVHLVLITLGYAALSSTNPFRQFWDLVVDFPGMLLALAGTLLLVLVAVTSLRRARARLRYESWHLLHLYAYLGAGLALPHQLWTGQDFLNNSVATGYWWSAWGACVGAFVVWRLGLPAYRTLMHDLRVVAVEPESPDVVSVWIRGRNLHRLPVAAGQFFTWRFLDGPGRSRGHPYSLSAAPRGDLLRITVKELGDGSHALARVSPGTRAVIEGPYGRLHLGTRTRRKVTLVGSGIGITPLRAILEELPAAPGDATVIYRARSRDDLVLTDEIDELAAARGARVFYVLGPRVRDRVSWLPQSAAQLSDAEALRKLVPDVADQDVYICGPTQWADAVRHAAREAGVPPDHIHEERFAW